MQSTSSATRPIEYLPGLAGGLIAGVAAILASLPLRSPHDAALNSATVAIGCLVASAGLSILWVQLRSSERRPLVFAVVCLAAVAGLLLVTVIVERLLGLERAASFVAPLAVLEFGVSAALVPTLNGYSEKLTWLIVPLVVAVIGLGLGLSGMGDQETGRLELPPRSGQ